MPPFFVADASFALAWAFADESNPLADAAWIALRNDSTTIHVPPLWMWEFINALLVGEKRGRISREGIEQCVGALSRSQIRIVEETPAAAFSELPGYMRTHGLTSYDAAYLALAIRSGFPIATFDKALATAAKLEGVELVA